MTAPAPPAPERDLSSLPKVTAATRTQIDGGGSSLAAALRLAVSGALLGYVAIVLAWAITEVAGVADSRELGPVALYFAILGTVYCMIVTSWSDLRDGILGRALVRAAIGAFLGAIIGALAGALSQVLFSQLQEAQEPGAARFYLLRALSWAAFGIGIGLAGGIAEQSSRKAVNGLIGGLIGGALGGLLFHFVSLRVDSESEARLLGLAMIGMCTGASIGLVEGARRQAWLRVIAGGLAGKQFILQHAVTSIGAAPKAQITLIKDPAVQPFHAQIALDGARRLLTPVDHAPVMVNGAAVRSRALRSGDQIQIGGTTLLYQERD